MPSRVGIYLRISDDRSGVEAGVMRQEEDCRRAATARGWEVVEVYRENDTSAFKRRKIRLPDGTTQLRVMRPEFRRMVDDLENGAVDGVVAYHLDRMARDPRDLEDLIDVTERTGRPVASVGGEIDLTTDTGRTMARIAVAIANQASRDSSRRVKRAQEQQAAEGRWSGGGTRAFGYNETRTEVVEAEAAVIRDCARRVLAGESMRSILRSIDIPTPSGGPWVARTMWRILTGGVAAGRLTYKGQDAGTASWPAILDAGTHDALQAAYARRIKGGGMVHYLTGLLVCGRCGELMAGKPKNYTCLHCNGVTVRCEKVEALVGRLVVGRLVNPPKVTTTPVVDDTQLAELAAMWGAQEISLAEYRAARAKIAERLSAAKPVRVPAWVRGDMGEQWPDLTVVQKADAARSLLDGVVVLPAPDRRWRPERIRPVWR